MTLATERARRVLALAGIVHEHLQDDPDSAAVIRDGVVGVVERDPGEAWAGLLDALQQRDIVEDTIAPQHRAAELDIADRGIARALWCVLNDGRPCGACLDRHVGEPHEVAARAGSAWSRGRGRRPLCSRYQHCVAGAA
jgi:hypothetical protein